MNRCAGVAAATVFVLVFGSCRFSYTKAVAESPDPFVRAAEVEKKRQLVLDEIERLGPHHPWAGVYHGYCGVPISLVVAPDAGCVWTIFGCFGLRDSKWSPVDASLVLGTCAMSGQDVRGHVTAFGQTFELVARPPYRILRDENGGTFRRQPREQLQFEKMR